MADTLYALLKKRKRFILNLQKPPVGLANKYEFDPDWQPFQLQEGRLVLFRDVTWGVVRLGIVKRIDRRDDKLGVELISRAESISRTITLCKVNFSDIYGLLRPSIMNFTT